MKKSVRCFAVGVAALGVMVALGGCGSGTTNNGPVAPPATGKTALAELSFVVSGDTAGFIVPCGCATKQFGGLPRRATYIEKERRTIPDLIYADAGGSIANSTKYDTIKLDAIWKGVRELKPAAMNLGGGEVKMGAARLKEAIGGLPALSCNVKVSGGETPWPATLSQTVAGRKLAWVGVYLGDASLAGAGLEVQDGYAALQATVPALAKEHDAVLVLAYGSEEACRKIADTFPEVSAIFGTGTPQPIPPRVMGGTVFAAAAQKGKFLARLNLKGGRQGWSLSGGEIVELADTIPDHPIQIENLEAYKKRLKAEPLDPAETGQAPALLAGLPKHYQYAGSARCAECHVEDGAIHKASKHHHGLDTLTAKGFDFDPYCLKCHTTGYGGPEGFKNANLSTGLGGIGCESCHGPSKSHAEDPLKRTSVPGKNACITCHDLENSPLFSYETYWPRIEHGKTKVDPSKLKAGAK